MHEAAREGLESAAWGDHRESGEHQSQCKTPPFLNHVKQSNAFSSVKNMSYDKSTRGFESFEEWMFCSVPSISNQGWFCGLESDRSAKELPNVR